MPTSQIAEEKHRQIEIKGESKLEEQPEPKRKAQGKMIA